ncbi:MFS transporter, partial [Herbaspirillum lusitanum]|uniref:MFS transporter n=1 Tax=Herbaspirillum lusitanum TaxID=213312 RepID=UPI00036A507D
MDDHREAADLDHVIEQAPISKLQIFAITICALVAILDGFDAQSLGMLAPDIGDSLGIARENFGPIFSAGFFGMFAGAVVLAPLADRHGRKPMLYWSTLIFGIFTIASAYSSGFYSLLILRFLTGVGLGGALPNILAYVSEYLPKKHMRTVIPVLMATVPLGAILGGALTSLLVPQYGWQSVLLVGGAIPVLLALFAIRRLPESARYLVRQKNRQAELEGIMLRITGLAAPAGG